MKKQFYLTSLLLLLAGCYFTSQAQSNWYTPEVRRELGQKVTSSTPAIPPPFQTREYKLKKCRIVSGTVAVFDTTATYAQGRVVNAFSHKPIRGALVQVTYSCCGRENLIETKTAITNSAGFFGLGWIGCAGTGSGERITRPLFIKAMGYPTISTSQVGFSGSAYLHIELSAAK